MDREIRVNISPKLGVVLEIFGIILGIIFTCLKLCHIGDVANWSWFWVTFPYWIPIAAELGLFILGLIMVGIILGIMTIVDHIRER